MENQTPQTQPTDVLFRPVFSPSSLVLPIIVAIISVPFYFLVPITEVVLSTDMLPSETRFFKAIGLFFGIGLTCNAISMLIRYVVSDISITLTGLRGACTLFTKFDLRYEQIQSVIADRGGIVIQAILPLPKGKTKKKRYVVMGRKDINGFVAKYQEQLNIYYTEKAAAQAQQYTQPPQAPQ